MNKVFSFDPDLILFSFQATKQYLFNKKGIRFQSLASVIYLLEVYIHIYILDLKG